jgi:pimeloyl-ACP methyl ester carboxylesterase
VLCRVLIGVILASVPGCCGSHSSTPPVPPTFDSAACPNVSPRAPRNARCGFLVVPENRTKANRRTIRLAVAIVPSVSRTPAPDPVVYLSGGPGGSAIGEAQLLVDAGVNRDRDLILMNQRGTQYSEPALTCPEIDQFFVRNLGLVLDAPSTRRLHAEAARACYRRLVREGWDLSAYNTTENAADFADLRAALGIAQWNVFGVSYGTNLALTLMRQHPEGIRSVTIDSVEPPEIVGVGAFWGNAREGFENLFAACADQPDCSTRHPELAHTFTSLVGQLESGPLTTQAKPTADGPAVQVVLDGGALVNWLVDMAFATPEYPFVPGWIGELADGHPEKIAASRARPVLMTPEGVIGYGLTFGVICSEWVPYERESDVLARGRLAFPDYPDSVLAPAVHFTDVFDDCRAWKVPKAPATQRATALSTIPTLVLSGSFDAVTPPSWGMIAARTLPNSTVVIIPGVGHFVTLASPCAGEVIASFLSAPSAPNTTCVANLTAPVFTDVAPPPTIPLPG